MGMATEGNHAHFCFIPRVTSGDTDNEKCG